ncbi:MAG: hypothetical protein V9G14_17720 [Cypionkella sp.]
MCSAANAPLARIVQAGLVKVNRPDEEVQAAMDEAALREMPKIAQRTALPRASSPTWRCSPASSAP